MNNSLFAASVRGGAGRQQAAVQFLLWSLLKESLSPCTAKEERRSVVVGPRRKRRWRTTIRGGGSGEMRPGGRRAKRNDEGGGPCYTTLVYFVVGTRQRCSTYTAHFASSPRFRILKSGSVYPTLPVYDSRARAHTRNACSDTKFVRDLPRRR